MKKILSALFAIAFVLFLSLSVFSKHPEGAIGIPLMAMGAGGMIRAGNDRDRSIYNALEAEPKWNTGGIKAPELYGAKTLLQAAKKNYSFNLKKLKTKPITEKKLNEQDAFLVAKVGLFLINEDPATPGISVPQSYPNPIIFPDEANNMLSAHLEHIYNGTLYIKVGDTIYVPGKPLYNCRVVNTAQKSGTVAHSEKLPGDGFVNMTPQVMLKGFSNNDIRVRVPGHGSHKVQYVTATTRVKMALILEGFIVTGAGTR